MPELMSAALFERGERALVAHRSRGPFAGQWMLPLTLVRPDETAEDALRRHARDEFGAALTEESFLDTLYVTDSDDRQYVANIFRAPLEGPVRFNAQGEYDDARWLAPDEIEQLATMPPDLRLPLVKILTEPESLHQFDWDRMADELVAQQAVPLAEQVEAADEGPAPDNRATWDAIADAYQDERYGDRHAGRLRWSLGVFEDELHLLDDVAGQRALVVGCGGGQDAVALERMGARVIGLDVSAKQIAYAKRYAQRHRAENVSFVETDAEDLSRFDDGSFDLTVSAHALSYVEHLDRALAEIARVLRTGGVLAISVPHPFNSVISDEIPAFRVERSYWAEYVDWDHWRFKDGSSPRFREWCHTVADWFAMLDAAGFSVESVVEPRQESADDEVTDEFRRRVAFIPYALILKARKR